MTNESLSDMNRRAVHSRWNPSVRHDSAMAKIEQIITRARRDCPTLEFTREDRARVVELMGGKLKVKAVDDNTPADNYLPKAQ